MRSPASEQKEREGSGRGGARETGKHRGCRLMKTNSICSQSEMKCILQVFGAMCGLVCIFVHGYGGVCDWAYLGGCGSKGLGWC